MARSFDGVRIGVALLFVVGCGKGGPTEVAAPSMPGYVVSTADDVTSLCQRTFDIVQEALRRCCTPADVAVGEVPSDANLQTFRDQCESLLTPSLARGRLLTNRVHLQACLAAYEARYGASNADACSLVAHNVDAPPTDDCAAVFSGTGSVGARCEDDLECQDGLSCVDGTSFRDGHCQRPPGVDQGCGSDRPEAGYPRILGFPFENHPLCAAGYDCHDGACVPSDGGLSSGGLGATCEGDGCGAGLACERQFPDEPGTCVTRKSAGETCVYAPNLGSDECWGRCASDAGGPPPHDPGACATFCGSK